MFGEQRKNATSRLTQPQVRVYSGDSVKCNPGGHINHNKLVNYSPISFSRDVKQSVPRAKNNNAQTLKKKFTNRRNQGWLQRSPHWQSKVNCKVNCSRPNSVRSRFTTLSQENAGKQERASLKMRYALQDVITKLMKGDNVSDGQLSSQVESRDEFSRRQKLRRDVAPSDSVDGSENNREV